MRSFLLTVLCSLSSLHLFGQGLIIGAEVGAGGSFGILRQPVMRFPTPELEATVRGGAAVGIAAVMGYEIDNLSFSLRPGWLRQRLSVVRLVEGEPVADPRNYAIHRSVLSLPAYLRWSFGEQRLRPFVRAGGGFLVNLGGDYDPDRPVPRRVLSFVEVGAGVAFKGRQLGWQPALSVRHATDTLFGPGDDVSFFTWGQALLTLTVTGAGRR